MQPSSSLFKTIYIWVLARLAAWSWSTAFSIDSSMIACAWVAPVLCTVAEPTSDLPTRALVSKRNAYVLSFCLLELRNYSGSIFKGEGEVNTKDLQRLVLAFGKNVDPSKWLGAENEKPTSG